MAKADSLDWNKNQGRLWGAHRENAEDESAYGAPRAWDYHPGGTCWHDAARHDRTNSLSDPIITKKVS